jgi:CRP-like cAMP-binding protein
MKDGIAVVTAKAAEDSELLRIPAASFHALMAEHPRVLRFFDRTRPARTRRQDITTIALSELMTRDPLTCVARHAADRGRAEDAGNPRLLHHRRRGQRGEGHPDHGRHHQPRGGRGAGRSTRRWRRS